MAFDSRVIRYEFVHISMDGFKIMCNSIQSQIPIVVLAFNLPFQAQIFQADFVTLGADDVSAITAAACVAVLINTS